MRRLQAAASAAFLALAFGAADCNQAGEEPGTLEDEAVEVGKDPVELVAGEGAVWVIDKDRTLRRIDSGSREVVGEPLRLPGEPRALALAEGAVWVAVAEPPSVLRVDPRSTRVAANVKLPFEPLALAAGDRSVWAAGEGRLARIDPARDRLDGQPAAVDGNVGTLAYGDGELWMGLPQEKELVRMDPDTLRARRSVPVPTGVEEIAVGAGGVWIAGGDAGDGEGGGSAVLESGRTKVEVFSDDVGLVDVERDAGGDVFTLSGTFDRRQTGTSRDISVRSVGRHETGTGRVLGTGVIVPDEIGRLAVGEGSVWLIHPDYGTPETGAIRRVSLKPRDELEYQD